MDVGELEAREPVVPGGAVRDQGVPPAGAPPLGDAVSLEHEVRHAVFAQMLAHRDAGLARADDEHLYRFVCHLSSAPGTRSDRISGQEFRGANAARSSGVRPTWWYSEVPVASNSRAAASIVP